MFLVGLCSERKGIERERIESGTQRDIIVMHCARESCCASRESAEHSAKVAEHPRPGESLKSNLRAHQSGDSTYLPDFDVMTMQSFSLS